MILQVPKPHHSNKERHSAMSWNNSIFTTCTYHSPISITSISSQSSVGSGKSRRFFRLKFNLPVSSASLKHLSSGMLPDMVGFTCYKKDIGTFTRRFFRRCGDILDVLQPTSCCYYAWQRHCSQRPLRETGNPRKHIKFCNQNTAMLIVLREI